MKSAKELKKLYTQLQDYFITLNKLAGKNIGQLIAEEEINKLINFPTSKESKEPTHPAKALIEAVTTYLSRDDQEKARDPIIQKKIIALFFDKDEQRALKVELNTDSKLGRQPLENKRQKIEQSIAKSKGNTDKKDYVRCINFYVFEMMDKFICLDRYKKINDIIKNSGKLPAEVSETVTAVLSKVLTDEGRTVDSIPTFLKLSEIDDWRKVEKELKTALPAVRQPTHIAATVGSSATVVTNATTTASEIPPANADNAETIPIAEIESIASTSTYTPPISSHKRIIRPNEALELELKQVKSELQKTKKQLDNTEISRIELQEQLNARDIILDSNQKLLDQRDSTRETIQKLSSFANDAARIQKLTTEKESESKAKAAAEEKNSALLLNYERLKAEFEQYKLQEERQRKIQLVEQQGKTEGLERELSLLQEQLAIERTKNSQGSNNIDQLNNEIKEKRVALEAEREKASELEQAASNAEIKTRSLQRIVNDQADQLGAAEASINTLQAKLEEISQNKNELENKLKAGEISKNEQLNKIQTLEHALSSLKTNLDKEKNSASNNAGIIEQLNTSIEQINAELSSEKNKSADLEHAITNYRAQLSLLLDNKQKEEEALRSQLELQSAGNRELEQVIKETYRELSLFREKVKADLGKLNNPTDYLDTGIDADDEQTPIKQLESLYVQFREKTRQALLETLPEESNDESAEYNEDPIKADSSLWTQSQRGEGPAPQTFESPDASLATAYVEAILTIDNLHANIKSLEQREAELEQQLAEEQINSTTLQKELDNANKKTQKTKAENQKLKTETIPSLEKQVTATTIERDTYKQEADKLQKEKISVETEAQRISETARQLQTEKDETDKRVRVLENEHDEKSEEIQTLTQKLSAAKAEFHAEKQNIEEIKLQLQQAQEKDASQIQDLQAHVDKIRSLELRLQQANEEKEETAERISDLQATVDQLPTQKQLLQAQQEAHQANNAVRQLQAEKNEANRKFAEADNRVRVLESERDEKSKAIQTLTQKLSAAKAELDAEEQTIEGLKLQLQQANEKAITNESTRKELQAEIGQLKLLETQLQQAQEKDASQIQDLQAHVDKIRSLELRLQQANEEEEKTAERIGDLQATIAQLPTQEQLESYKQTIGGLQNELDDTKQQHAEEMKRLTESLAYEESADNPNEGRNSPEMSANSANSRPLSPSTMGSDKQNQGETEMPEMKDRQPQEVVTPSSSLGSIHNDGKSDGNVGVGLGRSDSTSSGVSTGSGNEASTPFSSPEDGDNSGNHANNNKPETSIMALKEICEEIIAEIVSDKIIIAKKTNLGSLPSPLISTDLDDSLEETILDSIISEIDSPTTEEGTTDLINFVGAIADELLDGPSDRTFIRRKLFDRFNGAINDCIDKEIQTASTDKNKKIVTILASLTHENVTDKLDEIAKTAFALKTKSIQIQDLKPEVTKLLNFDQLESVKAQLKTQLEAMPVSELDQLQANAMERLLTIENNSSTLKANAEKIGTDFAITQTKAINKIFSVLENKAQEVIADNPERITALNFSANASPKSVLARTVLNDITNEPVVKAAINEVMTLITTDSEADIDQTKIEEIIQAQGEDIKSLLEKALLGLESNRDKQTQTNDLINKINPKKVIETLTVQAREVLTQQLEAKGYQANEAILTKLKQSILELSHRQFDTAKTKLRTELLESPGDLDTLSTEEVINALIHAKLESAPDKTLKTQADEAALKLSKQFMDHYKGATPADLEQAYLDILRSINHFDSDFTQAKATLTSRGLQSWLAEKLEKLTKIKESITNGEFTSEQNVLQNKINLTGQDELSKKDKATHKKSIQWIEDIKKKQLPIKNILTLLAATRTALEHHINDNNINQDKALINIAFPASRSYFVFDTNNHDQLVAARNDANTQLSVDKQHISTYTNAETYKTDSFASNKTLMLAANIRTKAKGNGHIVTIKICREDTQSKLYIDAIDNNDAYSSGGLFAKKTPIERYSNTPQNINLLTQAMLENAQGSGNSETEKATGILIINSNRPEWLKIYVELLVQRQLHPEQPFPFIHLEGPALNFLQNDKKKQEFDKKVEKLVTKRIYELTAQNTKQTPLQTSKETDLNEHNIRTNFRNWTHA